MDQGRCRQGRDIADDTPGSLVYGVFDAGMENMRKPDNTLPCDVIWLSIGSFVAAAGRPALPRVTYPETRQSLVGIVGMITRHK